MSKSVAVVGMAFGQVLPRTVASSVWALRLSIAALIWLFPVSDVGAASVYRCVDANAKVHFSDRACDASLDEALVNIDVVEPSARSRERAKQKLRRIDADARSREAKAQQTRENDAQHRQRINAQKRRLDGKRLQDIQTKKCRNVGGHTRCSGPTLFDKDGNVLPESARAEEIERLKKRLQIDSG